MSEKLLVLCAIMVLSVNFAYADVDSAKGSVSSGPLFKDTTTGMEFVFVKGGCYMMGDFSGDGTDWHGAGESNERPVHEVCVDDFYIGKYEVTGGQWKQLMGSNPSRDSGCKEGDDSCPVEFIKWSDIQDFIGRLNKKSDGSKYRLPTEAEWEYAARSGGKKDRYSGGNDIVSVGWYGANAGDKTHPVGTKLPNALGIYDMSGNVWETTSDWYSSDYYAKSPRNNPAGPDSGDRRVIRGGCATGSFLNLRTTRRGAQEPDQPNADGFRLLKTP